jgi:hypothetical protein
MMMDLMSVFEIKHTLDCLINRVKSHQSVERIMKELETTAASYGDLARQIEKQMEAQMSS